MKKRFKSYFWVTWLTPLLSGEDSCEWKVWMRGHYQDLNKLQRDFDSARWNENHTAYLNELRDEYKDGCEKILMEGQTAWKIDGRTATVAGKMDLITLNPNVIVDAKTGKVKDAHVVQVKIYLLALSLGAVPGVTGDFAGLLRYQTGETIEVPLVDKAFKDRFYSLVKGLAQVVVEPSTVPSFNECRFCDLADCADRVAEEAAAVTTEEF